MNVWQRFADLLNQTQRYDQVMISGVRSCLGPCQMGPVMVVYPEGIWYVRVRESDVDEIWNSHLVNGQPVERLRLPDEFWG